MMKADEDVTISDYFEKFVPEFFAEQISSASISGMDGTAAKMMFKISSGDAVHTYSLVIKDARELEVVGGPVDDPLVTLEMDEAVWRDAVTGKLEGAIDMFTDANKIANRARFDKISGMKGTLNLDLTRADGSPAALKVVFNSGESPQATFSCSLDTWVQLSTGQLAGVTAFMGGQLKITGDMPFAIELSDLVG